MSAPLRPADDRDRLITLHREDRRHSYFAAHLHDPPFFDSGLGAWVVTDPAHVEALIQSPAIAVADFAAAYERLEAAGRGDFPNIRFAFAHMSLAQNGERHRDIRRRHAAMIAASRPALAAALPEMVATALAPAAAGGEVELMDEIVAPLSARVMASVAGLGAADAEALGGVSTIFDRMLGPAKRAQIEVRMAALRALVRARTGAAAGSEEEGLALGLLVTGGDSLLGTLGESLHRILAGDPGARLGAIAWPEAPPETGVPYVERVATQPVAFAGAEIEAGDRVRFLLQALTATGDPDDRLRLFGFGARTCLGRALSLDLWRELAAGLARLDFRQEVVRYSPRTGDYAFTCPETLLVRLSR